MIAKYKNNFYLYISNKKVSNLVTRQKQKALEGFEYDEGAYFKRISMDELEDVFDIEYWVTYNTGEPEVPTEWKVGKDSRDIQGDNVLIRYSNGVLPNWNIEEKNVCVKYINKNEIDSAKIVKVYSLKDGVSLNSPIKEETLVDFNDLALMHDEFSRMKL